MYQAYENAAAAQSQARHVKKFGSTIEIQVWVFCSIYHTAPSLMDTINTAPFCRFFLQNWPDLCWLAFDNDLCFGTVVCKQDKHGEMLRGYIAMLVVMNDYRGLGVGKANKYLLIVMFHLEFGAQGKRARGLSQAYMHDE